MTRTLALAAAASVVALIAGSGAYIWLNGSGDDQHACSQSRIAGGDIGGPFTLVSETGETVTDKDVITGPSIVYFGYTFCPDVCPLDNARNAEAVEILDERGIEVTPIFISIDPERDTPEAMAEFTDVFHERMIGLTGSPEQVKAASKAYKTYYKKQESDDDEYYLVDHSTFSYLMFPEAGFVEFFKRDDTAEQIADRVQCFVEAGTK